MKGNIENTGPEEARPSPERVQELKDELQAAYESKLEAIKNKNISARFDFSEDVAQSAKEKLKLEDLG